MNGYASCGHIGKALLQVDGIGRAVARVPILRGKSSPKEKPCLGSWRKFGGLKGRWAHTLRN